jgi:hypothetical protein
MVIHLKYKTLRVIFWSDKLPAHRLVDECEVLARLRHAFAIAYAWGQSG